MAAVPQGLGRWIIQYRPDAFSGKRITSRSSSIGSVIRPARMDVRKSRVKISPVAVRLLRNAAGNQSGSAGARHGRSEAGSQYCPGGKARTAQVMTHQPSMTTTRGSSTHPASKPSLLGPKTGSSETRRKRKPSSLSARPKRTTCWSSSPAARYSSITLPVCPSSQAAGLVVTKFSRGWSVCGSTMGFPENRSNWIGALYSCIRSFPFQRGRLADATPSAIPSWSGVCLDISVYYRRFLRIVSGQGVARAGFFRLIVGIRKGHRRCR